MPLRMSFKRILILTVEVLESFKIYLKFYKKKIKA